MSQVKFGVKHLKELRFILSTASPGAKGLKSWLNKNFEKYHSNQNNVEFYVRECSDVLPVILARYGK